MTKIGQLIQEEIMDAANIAASEKTKEIAKEMLKDGEDIVKILKYTGLTRADVDAIPLS
jgi:hypothetical protein